MENVKFIIWLLYLGFFISPIAQNDWYYQNPVPTSSELKKVQFVTIDSGWSIGSWGTIIQTTDGGTTWNLQPIILDDICDISFVDGTNGWGVGVKLTGEYYWGYPMGTGYLIHTIDGGGSWQLQAELNGYTTAPFSVFFIDKDVGWITYVPQSANYNGVIIKTTNGGESWTVQDSVDLTITDTYFVNDQVGWAVGGWSQVFAVTILKTEDGGENWIHQYAAAKGVLESVWFIDENKGWAVGTENIILSTNDGGKTWSKQNLSQVLKSHQFTSVCFRDSNNGFIAGWGIFLTTTNGGQNWLVNNDFYPSTLSVFFLDQQHGWRVGSNGLIHKTVNGGDSWTNQIKSFTNEEFVHIDFVDKLNGWVMSIESIYHTIDGGLSWENQNNYPNKGVNNLYAVDNLNCWLVGYNWENSSSFIIQTSDGGLNWKQYNNGFNIVLNSAFFVDENIGWIVGDAGVILYTDDGGENWIVQESGTIENLFSVDFINDKCGWVLSRNGTILKTSNGGDYWDDFSIDTLENFQSLDFIDSLQGWLVGGSCWPDAVLLSKTSEIEGCYGFILKSNDGGKTWMRQLESNSTYNYVKFIDENNGWASNGSLYYTKDGGVNWEEQVIAFDGISSADFVDINTGWLVGMNGAIMHNSEGGITEIDSQTRPYQINQPKFLLLANFPNPFNPSTTIKYSIQKQSSVTLKVFDVLGSEVTTLVNKEQPQGNYEVEFDGSDLTSGIYFYRLQANDFIEARKMILLK